MADVPENNFGLRQALLHYGSRFYWKRLAVVRSANGNCHSYMELLTMKPVPQVLED